MKTIAVVGTFDSKGEEHLFLKERIEKRGFSALTINVGTKGPGTFKADIDLFIRLEKVDGLDHESRDRAIAAMLQRAKELVRQLHERKEICGIISAGGGTGTHLGTGIMRAVPMGVPKVMVSTVASRDMSKVVGTRDITMMHSVADLLGVNSISGAVLDRAAAAVCAMTGNGWSPGIEKKRIALTFFGFITPAAEMIKERLERLDYEVIAFHANGTGGMAMEELASEGYFSGILDLGTHELADELKGGYCSGIGPERLVLPPGIVLPRLVVPGGLDCAVLEFTREKIPEKYRGRKIFFYDFRSAVRLNEKESLFIAAQLSEKLNKSPAGTRVLVPLDGWSEADRQGGPLYDPALSGLFLDRLKRTLDPEIEVMEVGMHINDPAFARLAARIMHKMIG